MSIAIALHLIFATTWVGGMFFAYMSLRPAAAQTLDAPQRLTLWVAVFKRFFPGVIVAIVMLLATGYWMLFTQPQFDGFKSPQLYLHLMQGMAILMILLFLHVFFAPFKRLKRAVEAQDWQGGAKSLAQIRVLVAVNTVLGLLTLAIGAAGPHLAP